MMKVNGQIRRDLEATEKISAYELLRGYFNLESFKFMLEAGAMMINRKDAALKYISGDRFAFAPPGQERQNSLLVDTIELFGPHYTPQAFILHVNDDANAISIHEQEKLHQLGMYAPFELFCPDIILYQEKKQAIFFIEVATCHGSVTQRKKYNIEGFLSTSSVRRVYISACYNLDDYKQSLGQIAWGSYIWCAQIPDHIIFHW